MNQRKRVTQRKPDGTSKTLQHAAEGRSVKDIIARSGLRFPGMSRGPDPRVLQVFEVPSETLHEMMTRITAVNMAFAGLPARLKGKFGNSPLQMVQWIERPENRLEALKLGLVVPTPVEAQKMAHEAAQARRTEQVDLIAEAMKKAGKEEKKGV